MITCTFDGEQTSAHAEMCSMSLALQTLGWADNLHIGWDLKSGVDTMHASLAVTTGARRESRLDPHLHTRDQRAHRRPEAGVRRDSCSRLPSPSWTAILPAGLEHPRQGQPATHGWSEKALADWAAKRVTVRRKKANPHFTPHTLSHTRWSVVDVLTNWAPDSSPTTAACVAA